MSVGFDVVASVVAHLAAYGLSGVGHVGTVVPSDRHDFTRYLVVSRAGGDGDALVSRPRIRVQAFAESDTEAHKLALAVEDAMLGLPATDQKVSDVKTNAIYQDMWAGTSTRDASPCYAGLFDLVANR